MSYLEYENQVNAAMEANFQGWDFSLLTKTGRVSETPLSWNYNTIVRSHIKDIKTLLDMGTGGGEVLTSLSPLPCITYATESYLPNVDVAKSRLSSIGVEVIYVPENSQPPYSDSLPFGNGFFDVIINRHEAYYPKEIKRILKNQGIFITQQVGFLGCANLLKDMMGKEVKYGNWNLQSAADEIIDCGLSIKHKNEQISFMRFYDIGAVVYYLKAIPWLVEDFTPEKYKKQLLYIYETIKQNGYYEMLSHYFMIVAQNKGD